MPLAGHGMIGVLEPEDAKISHKTGTGTLTLPVVQSHPDSHGSQSRFCQALDSNDHSAGVRSLDYRPGVA